MIEPQAQQARHRHDLSRASTIPYFVKADRTRVKQVLINLLSNAIKYNRPGGTVVVDCALRAARSHPHLRRATPAPGCRPEQLAQLFQPFNRLGQEAGAEEGTGIGLVVSKRLVELMGGAIGVESTVGRGQRVLDRARPDGGAAAATDAASDRAALGRAAGARRRRRCARCSTSRTTRPT